MSYPKGIWYDEVVTCASSTVGDYINICCSK